MSAAVWCVIAIVGTAVAAHTLTLAPARHAPAIRPLGSSRPGRAGGRRPAVAAALDRRRQRSRRSAGWATVAEELAATLRAGASLTQALTSAASGGGASSGVLQEVLPGVFLGEPLAGAARRWSGRAGGADEALVAGAVELAAERGRADPVIFDTAADAIRERAAIAAELRAHVAPARASAAVLAGMPVAFTALLAAVDPSVVAFLFGSAAGLTCLAVGGALLAGGLVWMHRIVRAAVP